MLLQFRKIPKVLLSSQALRPICDNVWQTLVCATAKPLGSEALLSRQVFSAQGDLRQKLNICLEINFLIVFKIFHIVCSPNGNVKRPATSF
jgi:hypothetical protein